MFGLIGAKGKRPNGQGIFNPSAQSAMGLQFLIDPRQGRINDLTGRIRGSASLNGNAFVRGSVLGGDELVCDGAGDYGLITNQVPLNFNTSTNWTLAFWFYWSVKTAYGAVLELANGTGSGNRLVSVFIDGTSGNDFFVNIDTSGGATGGSITGNISRWPTGQWNHCAVVRRGTDLTGYENGVNMATKTGVLGASGGTSGGDLYLGRNITGGGSDWNGYIGPVAAWNYAKSDAEIMLLTDPRSAWEFYGVPSTRAYSFMNLAASAGFLLVKN